MSTKIETSHTAIARPSRRAFTLIELLVISLFAVVLLGLLVSALYGAQLGAGRREAMNKLKMNCLAMHHIQGVYKKLPPAFDKFGQASFPAPVHVHMLPFIEEDRIFQDLLKQGSKGEAANRAISPFLAPDDPSGSKRDQKGIQNFAANLRVFATKGVKTKYDADMPALAEIEPGTANIPRTFRDGTSNTMMFTTKYGYCGKGGSRYISPVNSASAAYFGQNAARKKADRSDKTATFQLRPLEKECCTSPLMAQSFYQGFILVGLADGSARQVSAQVTPRTWNCAVQPNDGQILGRDWDD